MNKVMSAFFGIFFAVSVVFIFWMIWALSHALFVVALTLMVLFNLFIWGMLKVGKESDKRLGIDDENAG